MVGHGTRKTSLLIAFLLLFSLPLSLPLNSMQSGCRIWRVIQFKSLTAAAAAATHATVPWLVLYVFSASVPGCKSPLSLRLSDSLP